MYRMRGPEARAGQHSGTALACGSGRVRGLSRTSCNGANRGPGAVVLRKRVAERRWGRGGRGKSGGVLGMRSEAGGEAVEMCEENLFGMYCNIDGEGRHRVLSLGQKEQLFLEALVCARGGQPRLTDAEYDALKEDLEWQGSLLATLTPEQRLLFEAAKAHEGPSAEEGQLLSDAEYDALRRRMRMDGVAFALPGFIVHGPRCSLRSRRVFTDVGQDVSRSFALNLPSLLLILLTMATVTAASGVEVPFGWAGYIAALLIAFPITITASRQLTSAAMDFSVVFTAQCPQCAQQLDVKLPRSGDTSFPLGCPHCQSTLSYDNPSHQVTLI